LACGLLALGLQSPQAAAGPEPATDARTDRRGASAGASVVFDWMRTAASTIQTEARPEGPSGVVWRAYVSTAVYNAVVGIEGRYAPYKWHQRGPRTASSEAAAASAAHHLLRHYFPGAGPRLDAALADSLAEIPDGRAEDEGVAFGKRAADHIIGLRRGDGRGASVPFTARPRPGVWRPTPPGFEPFTVAWLARLRPFLMDSPSQIRPGPPPALTSARYARDFNEVKVYGARTGSPRTPQQTDTARFFATLDPQPALIDHATRHHFDIAAAARLYAAANTAEADAAITAYGAKLHYGTWRPITAIRLADTDGNPATHPDRGWEPLLTTPAHPDYLSGHATLSGALMRTLTGLFGTSRVDLNVPSTSSGTRHYEYAAEYNRDVIDARVWAGIHTRTADTVGNATGQRLAD
jgi:hypothetical protein